MIRFSELTAVLPASFRLRRLDAGGADPAIGGVEHDSRQVGPGQLFVALTGAEADGHDYLRTAIEAGAAALVVERLPAGLDPGEVAVAAVTDTRRALAPLSAHFFGNPSHELDLIGITGTNGKTSTAMLVESILAAARRTPGLIGTVETRWPGRRERAINTTPESLELQRNLRAMRTAGVEAVVLEVSSHGLALGRVDACRFRVVAVTNVTQDHLDFHETMDAYREAKLRLFRAPLAEHAVAVVNLDDPSAALFVDAARTGGRRLITVSRDPDQTADVVVQSETVRLDGSRAELRIAGLTEPVAMNLPLIGAFNVENAVVALGVGLALEIPLDAILAGMARCPQVPGRIERIEREPAVLVDYAHTPDAVEKLLRTLRPLADERLITVFGCGGDRDRSKRPRMAEAVARYSDRVIATSDNPRGEDPVAILRDVEAGLGKLRRVEPEALDASDQAWCSLVDRREAIQLAIRIAGPGDTVVIAGKGHEDYQIIGRERLPFDDRDEARRALREVRG